MNWYRVLDILQVRPPGVAGRGIYFLSGQAITLDTLDDLGTSGVGCPGCPGILGCAPPERVLLCVLKQPAPLGPVQRHGVPKCIPSLQTENRQG